MALTGRFDFRQTPTGRIALQVEEEVTAFWSRLGERKTKRRSRKATLLDLTTPEMRTLMDLRMRPQYWTYTVEIDRAPAPRSAAVVPLSAPVVPEGPGTALIQARSATVKPMGTIGTAQPPLWKLTSVERGMVRASCGVCA